LLEAFPTRLRDALVSTAPDCWPCARDLLLPAQALWLKGQVQRADEVAPVYVRDEISWKKLAEQGSER
jgi:tRNA threonylcarbamoyladenosine biosynthesis protein TsaB